MAIATDTSSPIADAGVAVDASSSERVSVESGGCNLALHFLAALRSGG